MIAFATGKLPRHVALSAFALFTGLVLGRVEMVALAAPLLLALVLGLASARQPSIEVAVSIAPERCLEGDEVLVTIEVSSITGDEVEIALALPPGFEPLDPARVTLVLSEEPRSTTVPLRAVRWGAYGIGLIALRAYAPGGLFAYEDVRDHRRLIRVYPALERLLLGVSPPRTSVYTGNYVSRSAGQGLEFADVRPYERGDALRHVNWRVSSRRRELYVNVQHPERNTDVVLFVDTFDDIGEPGSSTLDLSVRGASSLARHYLARKDRVGLITFGGVLSWLIAGSGTQHALRIVDHLLEAEAKFSYAWKDIGVLPRATLPPGALVIAFTPLVDDRTLGLIEDLAARSIPLVVVDVLRIGAVEREPGPEGELAYAAWRLQRAALRFELAEAGVPVVAWDGAEPLDAALATLPVLRRERRVGV